MKIKDIQCWLSIAKLNTDRYEELEANTQLADR